MADDNKDGIGRVITPEELHAAAEKARLEERTKLRGEIDAATAKLGEITSLQAKVQEQAAELSRLQATVQTLEAAKAAIEKGGGVKLDEVVSQAISAYDSASSKELKARIAALQTELEAQRSQAETERLSLLRARLIAENGGEAAVIPALVTGSNEAELRASIAAAKQILSKHVELATGNGKNANGQGAKGVPPGVPAATAAGGAGGSSGDPNEVIVDGLTPADVRNMSRSEYMKHREKLKAALRNRSMGANLMIR